MGATKREEDERKEQVVSEFLNEIFYSKDTINYKKVSDRDSQLKGIDATFTFEGSNYICDEKAAVDYVNRDFKLNTFCLELSFLDRIGKERWGWFMDPRKENDSYLFVWIDKARTSELIATRDIYRAEIALVSRARLLELIFSRGFTEPTFFDTIKLLRDGGGIPYGPHGNRAVYSHGFKFTISPSLREQPVNMLISRDDLKAISDYQFLYIK